MSSIFSTPELAIGIAVGGAAGAAFEPKLEVPKQTAWANNPQRLPDVGLIAALVAGGKVTPQNGQNMANRLGYSNGTLDSLTWLAQNRLDFALMLRLWRLFPNYTSPSGKTIDALLDETLAHEQLDWDYHDLLRQLQTSELPGIGDIAYSVVRGYLPTKINLPVPPPATNDYVPRFPQSQTLAEDLAAQIGYDPAMLELMIARSGLSMAPIMAANALFRSDAAGTLQSLPNVAGVAPFKVQPYVGPNDYRLAISEGDLRTEWADAVRETAREILTTGEYAELELRGFIDKPTRRALAAQHGMSNFDSDLQYDVKGRAPAVHAITTGLARGAQYPSDYSVVPEPYRAAIQRSDIRPEFADIAYHNLYSYPSGFQIRAETQNGSLSQAESEQILKEVGWSPKWATFFSTAWSGGSTSGGDKHTAKAQTQLWTTTHKSYVAEEITDATATTALTAAGVAAAAIPAILALWAEERSLIRKQLSPTQIRKALNLGIVNPATGVAWTQADAIAAMLARGYDQADAEVFLQE